MSQLLFRSRRVLWMDPAGPPPDRPDPALAHCCEEMRGALVNACEEHAGDAFACADMLICYSAAFDEYGLIVHDGGASSVTISNCPWCGTKLPPSRRDDWIDALEARGLDPSDENLPPEFLSAAWRKPKD